MLWGNGGGSCIREGGGRFEEISSGCGGGLKF